jgi:V/A-type H+-transporting ATPase subunit C
MTGSVFVYSNARVKAMEKSLLSSAQITRLFECGSVDDAFKLLVEYGYQAEGAACGNFDALFLAEELKAAGILRELDVKGSGLSAFLMTNDFHNLKALVKSRELSRLEESDNPSLMPEGAVSVGKMREALISKDYSGLSKFMSDALKKLDELKDKGLLLPHIIDAEIDKAMYKEIFALLKKVKRKELQDYFSASADVKNISAFVRCKRLKLAQSVFEDGFIFGGSLNSAFFEARFSEPLESFSEKLKFTPYSKLGELVLSNFPRFEAACDDYLLTFFKRQKHEMFTASPVAGFYLGKLTEIRAVKLIVTAKKNNVAKESVAQRMRELYAQ